MRTQPNSSNPSVRAVESLSPEEAKNAARLAETRRLLRVVDTQLAARAWMMGDEYTVADIAIFPMVRNLIGFYGAGELVGYQDFSNVQRALEAFLERPAVRRGLDIPPRT